MTKEEIKLNTIISRLTRIENILMIMTHNLDRDHDHEYDQFKAQKRSDHDKSDQIIDQDLIDWFVDFLLANDIDPKHRDFTPKLRNIRYFWQKFDTISNPVNYVKSFLPRQVSPAADEPAKNALQLPPLTQDQVDSLEPMLTVDIVHQVWDLMPSLKQLSRTYQNLRKNPAYVSIAVKLAVKFGLLSLDVHDHDHEQPNVIEQLDFIAEADEQAP